jgi:hypothetical protein
MSEINPATMLHAGWKIQKEAEFGPRGAVEYEAVNS